MRRQLIEARKASTCSQSQKKRMIGTLLEKMGCFKSTTARIFLGLLGIMLIALPNVVAWSPRIPIPSTHRTQLEPSALKQSATPFESGFYDGEDDNPYGPSSSSSSRGRGGGNSRQRERPLKAPPGTKLVIGLNKYSHDTSICAADARTGEVLFAMAKERLTRIKHDAGNVASLVETCLDQLDLDLDDVDTVIMNNHHHRIMPLEASRRHMEFECGLKINGGTEDGYDDDYNVLPDVMIKKEISHHLAHAYSAAAQSPFDSGMIVIMDGMGETYRTMMRAYEFDDDTYISDFALADDIEVIPSDIFEKSRISHFDWREAESIYTFVKNARTKSLDVRPIFKRFTPENSPPTLYNHGFENMDSVGAIYSRAASDIFGDWNACGKVMGLAPWMVHSWETSNRKVITPDRASTPIMSGTLYSEEPGFLFKGDKNLISGTPTIATNDPTLFDKDGNFDESRRYDFDDNTGVENSERLLPTETALGAITLASRIQTDLEDVVMDFVSHFKVKTKEVNLCLAGGVALNSVLNGRLARELGFERTFIPPYPGDDGIAVGCCAYGLFGLPKALNTKGAPVVWRQPLSPYLGTMPTDAEIRAAIMAAEPWLEVEAVRDENRRIEIMAQEVDSGGVIAWYQGRSEMGPRALGHRSILADPRTKGLVRFINQQVKKRETFRPFAPSVLAEYASEWFEIDDMPVDFDEEGFAIDHPNNVSPYMSQTAFVRPDKEKFIPAVTHVDGSSRLQTVTVEADPLYHKFITKFYEMTGCPMVLNTSFNTLKGEPIVETPQNAIRSFLNSMGAIEMLVIGDFIIKRKQPDLRKLLGETTKDGETITIEPACPKRTGPAFFESSFELYGDERDEDSVEPVTKVKMPSRPMHCERTNAWFKLNDELEGEVLSVCDGTVVLNDILAQYTSSPDDAETSDDKIADSQVLAEETIRRLVRLFEHTLISW